MSQTTYDPISVMMDWAELSWSEKYRARRRSEIQNDLAKVINLLSDIITPEHVVDEETEQHLVAGFQSICSAYNTNQ